MWNPTKWTSVQDEDVIEAAMRSAPLAPPPPLLYASIMRQVRQRSAPAPFRIHWLDVALSLIFSAMLGAAAWVVSTLDPRTVEYARLWLEYYRLNLVYLHWDMLVMLAAAAAAVMMAILVWVGLGPVLNRR